MSEPLFGPYVKQFSYGEVSQPIWTYLRRDFFGSCFLRDYVLARLWAPLEDTVDRLDIAIEDDTIAEE